MLFVRYYIVFSVLIWSLKMANTPLKEISVNIGLSPLCKIQTSTENTLTSLEFTYKFMRQLTNDNTSDSSYIQTINSCLTNIQLRYSDRLESRLYKECGRITRDYKKVKGGNSKTNFDLKVKSISLLESEVGTVNSGSPLITNATHTPNTPTSTPDMRNTNSLRIDSASGRHKRRIVRKLESNASKVLEFVETYGALPQKLVCETFDGDELTVSVNGVRDKKSSYDNSQNTKQNEIKEVLNICDSAMISDEAYHELAMKYTQMPRKSHLVSCRQDTNTQFDVKRTPGMLPGSHLSLKADLLSYIESLKASGNDVPRKLKIKVSGDGARVSRVSNFVVVSYSLINGDSQSQSCMNQRVLAIVNCDEKYTNLRSTLGPLFDEINELNSDPEHKLVLNDDVYDLEMFVGGDMKFVQLLLGLNSSIATYACPWCKVSKETRGNIVYPINHYNCDEKFRTINEIKNLATNAPKLNYGVKHRPLLNIEPDHYVPDELHLMLRITDVLLRNLIDDAKGKDDYGKLINKPTDNLEILVKTIQSCGINFQIWLSKSGELEWTSMTGGDKKKLLDLLPDKLVFCLHQETLEEVVHLWKEFRDIYHSITSRDTLSFDENVIFSNIHQFITNFLRLGEQKREGYQPKNITPYMHVLLYHVPMFLSRYGSLWTFSGQGVEKTNDIIKRIHQGKSNKLDATTEALLVRKRIELGHVTDLARTKRKYEKKKDEYWTNEISQSRQMKKKGIADERRNVDSEYRKLCTNNNFNDFEHMSVSELKETLLVMGITTKVRTKTKLIQMVRNHIASE